MTDCTACVFRGEVEKGQTCCPNCGGETLVPMTKKRAGTAVTDCKR